jgi:hypothetical protein
MSVQLTTVEGKPRKEFTASQRLEILREWDATGNGVEVSRRYGIHPLTLYRWKKRLEQGAAEFLITLSFTKSVLDGYMGKGHVSWKHLGYSIVRQFLRTRVEEEAS